MHLWQVAANDRYTLIEQSLNNRTILISFIIHSNITVFLKLSVIRM